MGALLLRRRRLLGIPLFGGRLLGRRGVAAALAGFALSGFALAGFALAGFALAVGLAGAAVAQQGGAASAQVQVLEEEVRRLNGKIERLEFNLRRISEDAAQRLNDLEYRLTELEGGDPGLVGAPVPLGEPAGTGRPQPVLSEQVALDEARALLTAGDPDGARQFLLKFLSTHSDGPLTAEAEYWLGMAEWARGDAQAAAMTFLTTVTAYPESPRAAESLLMLGRSLARLDQKGEACATLAEVGRRYSGSAAVAEAEAERGRLACP